MFDGTITVKNLLTELRNEVDIALPIEDSTYLSWLNALEQMLYSEIIKEQKRISPVFDIVGKVSLENLNGSCEAPIRFEDIHSVYVDDVQLIKSTVASGVIFDGCYYKDGNDLYVNVEKYRGAIEVAEIPEDAEKGKVYKTGEGYFEWKILRSAQNGIDAEEGLESVEKGAWVSCGDLSVVYFVRPEIKETAGNAHIMVPIEFMDLVRAKLRGEAYKVANADDLAAKWLNDYNILLEQFKIWIAEKSPVFGL